MYLNCLKHIHFFPARDHLLMPNDQSFSIISKLKDRVTIEILQEWNEVIKIFNQNFRFFN